MKSWVTTDVVTGERRDALGQNVRGFAVYTPERVMFLILKNNRKPPERSLPTDEEKIALYDTMFAYSGSYTVESDRVIHHVDMSWNEAWSGTEPVRYGAAVDDRTLTYTTAPAGSFYLSWRCSDGLLDSDPRWVPLEILYQVDGHRGSG